MVSKIHSPILNGKPLNFYTTHGVTESLDPAVHEFFTKVFLDVVLPKFPHDMFVIENSETGGIQFRVAGYHLKTNELDEKTIVFKTAIGRLSKVIWLKIDDYESHYVATFLFPEEN